MRRSCLLASLLLIPELPAQAQIAGPAAALARPDDILVVGTPLSNAEHASAASPVQSASAHQIDASHANSLTDYLTRMTGGVFVNDVQNNPLQPDVNYRGFTASPLLGTPQGLSVYWDGVRVNQPFGDVVSWDLIPKSAIESVTLMPGSNPLFGRNSLGGALSIRTKDGRTDPGFEIDGSVGSFRRRTVEAAMGGSSRSGFNWFASGNYFNERGWRDYSPSRAFQAFTKLGWADSATDLALSGSYANTDLNGNGLQDQRLLAVDRSSVYTQPDNTRNRAWLANLTAKHRFSDQVSFSGNFFYRDIRTRTFNGDINDDALGGNLYQPNAVERAALAAAGYTDYPMSGETQDNTPFPRFRCIATVLLNSDPNERCDGLANRSRTSQQEWGGTIELTVRSPLLAGSNQLTMGLGYVDSIAAFAQSSQFGYLTPDRGVVPVDGAGAFADGTQESDDAFDARVDLTGRTRNFSAYALDGIDLTRTVHVDLSARYDHTSIRNRDAISPGGGTGSLDSVQRFARLNPALALRWTASKRFAADVAIAQTSRAPSAIELGCSDPASPCRLPNALAGDPPLDQVVARTIEGGVNADIRGVALRLEVFRTTSRNDILFVTDDASGFGYYRNFGMTRRQGIDVDAAASLGKLRLSAHYTFLDATYRTPETVDGSANSSNDGPAPGFEGDIQIGKGDRIPLIPRHIFKAATAWSPNDLLTFNVDMIAVAGVYARGNENNQDVPDGVYYIGEGRTRPYAVANLGVEVHPAKGLSLYVQVDNVFDEHYATAAQLSATGFGPDGSVRVASLRRAP